MDSYKESVSWDSPEQTRAEVEVLIDLTDSSDVKRRRALAALLSEVEAWAGRRTQALNYRAGAANAETVAVSQEARALLATAKAKAERARAASLLQRAADLERPPR